MKSISATEVKTHFGKFIEMSLIEPVIINRTGRSVAVILSFDEYNRLTEIEDAYWGEKARKAEKEGYIGEKESIKYIQDRVIEKA
ncbi:MAG: type II toxin-antitoxin system Phd/YefM family antitoxin [Magnetococcus sp. YQC-3]